MKKKHEVYTALLPRGIYLGKCRCGWEATVTTEAELYAHDEENAALPAA